MIPKNANNTTSINVYGISKDNNKYSLSNQKSPINCERQ